MNWRPSIKNLWKLTKKKFFRFTNIQQSIEGSYVCSAENSAGNVTATAQIIVQSPPRLTITPNAGVMNVKEGSSVRLVCRGEGKPLPVVYWEKVETTQP